MGGLNHLALEDRGLRHQDPEGTAGFKDIAVLYRLHALGPELERVLQEAGIPCQQPREGVGPEWDGLDLAAERVKLLSLHAAKGLEFPYVFIAGCEEGLIPWEPPGELVADPAEERRLFYVGLTRASRQVFLSRARERLLWGQKRRPGLSPWVKRAAGGTAPPPGSPGLFQVPAAALALSGIGPAPWQKGRLKASRINQSLKVPAFFASSFCRGQAEWMQVLPLPLGFITYSARRI